MQVARALVCLRYGIGDLVMELPALQGLRRLLPRARITALGAGPAIELLRMDGWLDELVQVQDFGLTHWGDKGTPGKKELLRQWLRKSDFGVIIDPSHAVLAASEIIYREYRNILDTGHDIQDEALARGEHGVAAIKTAVRARWGLAVADGTLPAISLLATERAFAAGFLEKRALEGNRLFGFSPVASSVLKRWPVDHLAALADHLLATRFDAALLFAGHQKSIAHRLMNGMQHRKRVTLVADFHLRLVAALLACCRFFVGNDTGLLHMAAAVQVPVLGIYGPTSPAIYLPPGAAVAASNSDFCPHRKTASFGPPACLIVDRCLQGGRGCIVKIASEEIVKHLRNEKLHGMGELFASHP